MLSLIASLNVFALWMQQAPASRAVAPSATPTPISAVNTVANQSSSDTLRVFLGQYFDNLFVPAIWVLFFAALYTLIRYLLQIPRERRQIEIVGENHSDVVRTAETDPAAVREELLKNVDRNSVVAERVEELHQISAQGGDFDQVALSEVLAARVMARTSIAKYVASVLVLLGLCGAIFGLSGLVSKMGTQLNEMQKATRAAEAPDMKAGAINESINSLVQTMSVSLSDTRGAFFASLTGILLSVVLLFINWYVSRRQVRLLADLEALTATKLIPLFKPPSETRELAEVVNSFKEGSGYLVRLSDELDDRVLQVSGSLENLFAIVRKFGEGADALQGSQENIYQAQERMLHTVEQFTALAERIEQHQSGVRQTIDDVVGAVRENSAQLTRVVEEWQKRHESVLQLIQNSSRQSIYEAQQSRESIEQAVRQMNEALRASIDQQLGQLRAQTLEALEVQQTVARAHLADVVADNGRFIAQLQDAVGNVDGHGEMLEVARSIDQNRRDLVERIDVALTRDRETFAEGINRLCEQNRELIQAVRESSAVRGGGTAQFALRAPQATPSGGVVADQSAVVEQVEELRRHAGHLGAVLSVLLFVIGAAALSFAAATTITVFDLWPEEQMPRALVFTFTIIVSLAASAAASFLLHRRALAER